jgi:CheY-like chemotaxis protein
MPIRKVLHIDDDEDDQEILSSALLQAATGVQLESISNARKALQQLSADTLHPDIIFLDLNMPEMNGQQFLSEIKKNNKLRDIPVIVLSTSSHPPTISLTKDLGAEDFITKPDSFDDLVHILKTVLNKSA